MRSTLRRVRNAIARAEGHFDWSEKLWYERKRRPSRREGAPPAIVIKMPPNANAAWWSARAAAWRQSVESWKRLGETRMMDNCWQMANWCQSIADGREITYPNLSWEIAK